jgi:fumarate hydratase class I
MHKTYGGFYLGSIGGPAAILAQDNILKVEIVDFEELEWKVRKITIKDFLLFIITDDKGNDFLSSNPFIHCIRPPLCGLFS